MMALSGVRSSWLILARNSDLARLAISASSREEQQPAGHFLQVAALLFKPRLGFLQLPDLAAKMPLTPDGAGDILDLDKAEPLTVGAVQRADQDKLVYPVAKTVAGQ